MRALSAVLLVLLMAPERSDPVILLSHDVGVEVDHFGLEPEQAVRATNWLGLYDTSAGPRTQEAGGVTRVGS